MTIDTQKLADDIAKVMELEELTDNGTDLIYLTVAPLMIDIIKRQGEVLEWVKVTLNNVQRCTYNEDGLCEVCQTDIDKTLSLLRKDESCQS